MDKAEICLDMANVATRFFSGVQSSVRDGIGDRDEVVRMVRQLNFEEFQKNARERGGPGTTRLWEIRRQWGELGVKLYLGNPDANPEDLKRDIYQRCATGPG